MNFLCQGFRKLSSERQTDKQTDRQTDMTEIIMPWPICLSCSRSLYRTTERGEHVQGHIKRYNRSCFAVRRQSNASL